MVQSLPILHRLRSLRRVADFSANETADGLYINLHEAALVVITPVCILIWMIEVEFCNPYFRSQFTLMQKEIKDTRKLL